MTKLLAGLIFLSLVAAPPIVAAQDAHCGLCACSLGSIAAWSGRRRLRDGLLSLRESDRPG